MMENAKASLPTYPCRGRGEGERRDAPFQMQKTFLMPLNTASEMKSSKNHLQGSDNKV